MQRALLPGSCSSPGSWQDGKPWAASHAASPVGTGRVCRDACTSPCAFPRAAEAGDAAVCPIGHSALLPWHCRGTCACLCLHKAGVQLLTGLQSLAVGCGTWISLPRSAACMRMLGPGCASQSGSRMPLGLSFCLAEHLVMPFTYSLE